MSLNHKSPVSRQMRYLVFDTETTGLPPRDNTADPDPTFSTWPHIIQISWLIWNSSTFAIEKVRDLYLQLPPGKTISPGALEKHLINPEHLAEHGVPPEDALTEFAEDVKACHYLVAHNLRFDIEVSHAEYVRRGMPSPFESKNKMRFCTMEHGKPLCGIMKQSATGYMYVKSPTLTELHNHLFRDSPPPLENLHNSLVDVLICCRAAIKMITCEDIAERCMVDGRVSTGDEPAEHYWGLFNQHAAPIPAGQH